MSSKVKLGSVVVAGISFEVFLDPGMKKMHGECDLFNRTITVRDRDLRVATHELFHALLWAHGLDVLIKKDAEEAFCCAVEMSWEDAFEQMKELIYPANA